MTPRRVRAVGFDLDGTLIDTLPDLARALNAMLGAYGCAPLPEARVAGLIGEGAERMVERALESLDEPAKKPSLPAALALFRAEYAGRLYELGRVYPGVHKGLRGLREGGLRLCCITNKAPEFALPLLAAARLAGYFDCVHCAESAEERKPSPLLLRRACTRFGVEPVEFLYVGDSALDAAAAQAAGCPVALVGYGYGRVQGASIESLEALTALAQC